MFDQFLVVLFVYVDCQISACSTWWQNSDASQVAPKLVCNGSFEAEITRFPNMYDKEPRLCSAKSDFDFLSVSFDFLHEITL